MEILKSIVAFLVAIGILVTIHELGHYWAARLCGVKIIRFSIGFGRPLWIRKFGADQTEWVVAALPLGGFVKMADERDDVVDELDRGRAFNNKPVWQRMIIITAGPAANFVLAALLYWMVFVVGAPGALPFVAAPPAGSPAAAAGFLAYDKVTAIDGKDVKTWGEVRLLLLDRAAVRGTAVIEVQTRDGRMGKRKVSMASLEKADLDRDFAAKLGIRPYRPPIAPVVETVAPDGPAAQAGLQPGDRIVAAAGTPIAEWTQLVGIVSASPGKALKLIVESGGETFDAEVIPKPVIDGNRSIGRIGIAPKIDRAANEALVTIVRYGPVESVPKAVGNVWDMSVFSLTMLGRMITGEVSWKNLSGPITIADYAGQSAKLGWVQFVTFLALISVSIGVLNLLPIPVLDGGQLLYHIAELIKGSPLSEQAMEIGQRVGFALLIWLSAFAFYNDIYRLVSG
ncbi:MAG: RIP metalloprotease RseP [Rhodocyclaceae bacterium]|nr:RIP metalloprotease RseP [Rhodocyclaceae bacterium]MCA3024830.1 RIP metalloprotease RseP [Rhodocyclaceae bacterium]MCA3032344.1 RIP metalloprotease RseP [Rhodocyclaceae bacterium]MCA3037827.1 RIP metalloprotease RseP [Rhodocyclaceae bacterium]MCA3045916.1 RIP metalloprotease RseP [Rhodocyclaceae bacterium]